MSLRERNKAEKLARIRQAASDLFIEKGYDTTTMREIAQRADIGFGTLFTYASDKRDLLFLIFNFEITEVIEEAMRNATKHDVFLDQLVAFFRCFYKFFALRPALSRFVLRELTFYVEGKQAEQFQKSRDTLLQGLGVLTANAKAKHQLGSTESPEILARALLAIYTTELRRWLAADAPDLKAGSLQLRRMLQLVIEGFKPKTGAI